MNTRLDIIQPPVAPCAGHLTSTTNEAKIQTQSSAERSTTSLSLAHQRKNKQKKKQKLSTNFTLYKTYTNHWTNLRRAETKRKKKIQSQNPGKGDLKYNKLKKEKKRKGRKYYKNEGKN